jgi:hypothetical protein
MATFPSKVDYATGDILTATNMNDIGGAINLLDGAQFAAGKNKIINGDFGIWQRGTSFTASGAYTADRFKMVTTASQGTVSQQTFALGAAPVAGYEAQYFLRYNATASNLDPRIIQEIEDVRTFAGQTVTLSFWAKSNLSDSIEQLNLIQIFGSGGSTQVITAVTGPTITSSWARYSATFAIPSISGKTIGTNSSLRVSIDLKNSAAFDFDVWGVQVEAGSTASNFQTATGTKQGELAACQRYYYRAGGDNAYNRYSLGLAQSTTVSLQDVILPVTMRIPTGTVDFSTTALYDGVTLTAVTAITIDAASKNVVTIKATVASGLTQYRPYELTANNSTSSFLGFSAEL